MKKSYKLQNIKCGGCVNSVEKALSNIRDLENVQVDLDSKTLHFDYIREESLEEIKSKLAQIGFPIE